MSGWHGWTCVQSNQNTVPLHAGHVGAFAMMSTNNTSKALLEYMIYI